MVLTEVVAQIAESATKCAARGDHVGVRFEARTLALNLAILLTECGEERLARTIDVAIRYSSSMYAEA